MSVDRRTVSLILVLFLPVLFLWWFADSYMFILLAVFAIFLYIYPLYEGINPTFYYWKAYNQKIHPNLRLFVRYPVGSLLVSSIVATSGVWYLSQSEDGAWLIVITAFYASILLFREVFFDYPLIELSEFYQIYGITHNNLSIETAIGNIGNKTATAPRVGYRIYDNNGEPLNDRKVARIPGTNRSLDPGEWTQEQSISLIIDLTQIPENVDEVYLHARAYSGFGSNLLSDDRIKKIHLDAQ